jgi:heavy metal sensor kinase
VKIPLRTSLTVSYAATLVLFLAILGFAYYHAFARQLDVDANTDLAEMTRGVHGYLRFAKGPPVLVYDTHDSGQVAFIHEATRYFQVYDGTSGHGLLESPTLELLGLAYTPEQVRAFLNRPVVTTVETDQGKIRFSNSVISPTRGERYLVQLGVPLDSRDEAIDHFLALLIWSLPACVLVVVGMGRWMAGRALEPLARLAATARTIRVEDLHRRLPVRGVGDELDAVAEAFNDVVARLARAIDEMRQFSAAMAHEIRTPLAAIRADMELSLTRMRTPEEHRDNMASQIEEIDKLTHLLGELLTLSRAEAGELVVAHNPVPLPDVCRSVVEAFEPVAQAKDISLTFDCARAATILGDYGWMERLLINLVDNAIKFTQPGGHVRVRLTRSGRKAALVVQDSGAGIAPDALPHVFDRFYQADSARSAHDGAGLGLALAKWIADRHSGTIDVASRPGCGSTFTVNLPLETSGVPNRQH